MAERSHHLRDKRWAFINNFSKGLFRLFSPVTGVFECRDLSLGGLSGWLLEKDIIAGF
jgi:hypothetical protein